MKLSEKQRDMLIDFHISGCPVSRRGGLFFQDGQNERVDMRTLHSLASRGLVIVDGAGLRYGQEIYPRYKLTEEGKRVAEELYDEWCKLPSWKR